ncbi:Rrf2 family transcriptional regulator [Maricaulis sp.]|uniref:RrF2 family transcriptional regulator n=1 Tax=unclassified Maricaulis TaxID=2632371 RepID=UPI001B0FEDAF|nr:Rrf2 family transcriptional regulator [Maricaulis sp.]MBO6797331.1 Rrf2 family transcriptional regulator [Maricaulis sp.]
MRLTLHTDYALRLLMMLAARPGARVTVPDMAERNRISRNHLMKVAQALVKAGYVRSIRGKGGGLELAREPSEISLGEVVREIEPDFSFAECHPPRTSNCCLLPVCGLNGILSEAGRAFQAVLDQYTLVDLLLDPARARDIIALPAE